MSIPEAATVSEVIKALSLLPQDLPVFVRPKYWGTLKYFEDAPVKTSGISEMEPNGKPKNVTILI